MTLQPDGTVCRATINGSDTSLMLTVALASRVSKLSAEGTNLHSGEPGVGSKTANCPPVVST